MQIWHTVCHHDYMITNTRSPLKEARHRASLDQYELADMAGVTQPFISRLETGQRKPSRPTGRKIAAALGSSEVELFGVDQPRRGLR